jgi:hypothetical protein
MADELSLQDLEEFEKLLEHKLSLLNQADQLLKQEQEAVTNFGAKHPQFSTYGHSIADAISDVELVITDAVQKHNTVVAKVQEAKAAAQQYEPDSI